MRIPSWTAATLLAFATAGALAQGQDSTPAERHLRVLAELLPGHYVNTNQVYFDGRRGLPQAARHALRDVRIVRREAQEGAGIGFDWDDNGRTLRLVLATVPGDATGVQAELLRSEAGAWRRETTLRFQRSAGGFTGTGDDGRRVQVSANELWLDAGNGDPDWLERSRLFHCYADIPGVGGGRDIPFERYDDVTLHDKGGEYWFTTRDAQERRLGFSLLAVNWHVLNEAGGNFNRNSLVLYVKEKLADGSVREHGYAFTEPGAGRIGVNLKWMLVNCALTPRHLARPEL